jgi:hypothetical protein
VGSFGGAGDYSLLDWFVLLPFREGLRPTMKGLRAGFSGLEVGKVLMLRFKSSLDVRLLARCLIGIFVLMA